jgi:hypothetical protein
VTYNDGKDVSSTVKAVAQVDAVVLVVGLTSEGVQPNDEAENHDRVSLRLPSGDYGDQEDLITKVSDAAGGKPVILVVMSGGPVDIAFAKNSAKVSAIMWCGYPGQSGGDSMADAIFGLTNRFGKLTQSWYPESFAQKVSVKDMGMRPDSATGNPGRSYRFYTGPTVFHFGEGLSYTSFQHDLQVNMLLSASEAAKDVQSRPLRKDAKTVGEARVAVTNSGQRDGDAVIMLFASPPASLRGKNGVPLTSLISFERVALAAGQRTSVSFGLSSFDFSPAGEDGLRQLLQGEWRLWVGSSDESVSSSSGVVLNVKDDAAIDQVFL